MPSPSSLCLQVREPRREPTGRTAWGPTSLVCGPGQPRRPGELGRQEGEGRQGRSSVHQARCYKNASNADCFSLSGGAAGRPNCALPAPQRPLCRAEVSGLLISRQPPPSNGEIMGLHLCVLSAPYIMGNRCSQRGPSGEGCPQGLARASQNQPVKADLKAQQDCRFASGNTRTFRGLPGALLGLGAHHPDPHRS